MTASGSTQPSSRALRRHLPWLAALTAYAGSRVFYTELGVVLDERPLDYFWQYLDLEELRTNLLEAVFYQHTQPPLFNLYLGLGLRTSDPLLFFRAVPVALGLGLHLGIYGLARQLAVRPWLASAASITFALSPASILMETWLFYTYPVAALLVMSAFLLHRGIARESRASLSFALALMALVVLTRSLFHLAWMLVAIAIVVALSRRRARTLALALAPLALAGSVYVKNTVVFGRPVASTWMGFSLSRLTTTKLDLLERRRLMHEGALSELADRDPWLPLHGYPLSHRAVPERFADIAVLSRPMRSTGHPNYNHAAYLEIGDAFARDARVVLERAPEVWWESAGHAWELHFLPIHDYTFFHEKRRAAGPWMRRVERVYEAASGSLAFARWSWEEPMPPFPERPGWAWAVVMALALAVAAVVAARRRRGRATSATLLYCAMTIVWVSLVGNSLEVGENQRFRFLSEPLTWVLVALALDRLLDGARGMRRRLRAVLSPQTRLRSR